jgi:hypothetical protein
VLQCIKFGFKEASDPIFSQCLSFVARPQFFLLTLTLLLTACVNGPSEPSTEIVQQSASPGTVLRSGEFGSSAQCPQGGVLIEIGLDTDGNGELDAEEVQQRYEVCNGLNGNDGQSSLVTLSAELPGAECTYGGTRIDSGIDGDDSGVLEASEITDTSYVCESQTCAWSDNGDGTSTVSCEGEDAIVLLNPEALEYTGRTTCVVSIDNPDNTGAAIPLIYTIDAIGSGLKYLALTILDGVRQNTSTRLLTSTSPGYDLGTINVFFDNFETATGGQYVARLNEVSNEVAFTYFDSELDPATEGVESYTQVYQAFDDASDGSTGLCSRVLIQ